MKEILATDPCLACAAATQLLSCKKFILLDKL